MGQSHTTFMLFFPWPFPSSSWWSQNQNLFGNWSTTIIHGVVRSMGWYTAFVWASQVPKSTFASAHWVGSSCWAKRGFRFLLFHVVKKNYHTCSQKSSLILGGSHSHLLVPAWIWITWWRCRWIPGHKLLSNLHNHHRIFIVTTQCHLGKHRSAYPAKVTSSKSN